MSSTPDPATSRLARPRSPADAAIKRLDGIGDVLSDLDVAGLRTQAEMTRALWTLNTADKCVRLIMAEFRAEPATEQMKRASERLMRLIELARDQLIAVDGGRKALG